MPDILTHAYCADFARRHFDSNTVIRQFIDRHLDAFYLGSQGPDFFFYYRIWPWKNEKSVPDLAPLIHKTKTAEFLTAAIHDLKTEDVASVGTQMTLAYWMGFICHYALDSTAHPYIYYHAGIHNDEEAKLNGDKHNHKFLENIIDTLLSERFENIMDLPINQYVCLPSRPASLKPVYEHLTRVFNTVYEEELTPDVVLESVNDMKKLAGLLHDPKKKRRKIYAKLEKMIAKPRYITTAAYPAASDMDLDYLNLKHKKWVHPCDVSLEYNHSFIDLFDQSTIYAAELMQYAWETFKDTNNLYDLEERLGNFSYDTGLKCGDPRELRFSSSIFKQKP